MKKRTPSEVRQWLREKNLTQAEWGRQNGFHTNEISRVLTGKSKLRFGREREIALRLKMINPQDIFYE